jgi:hypothetical protein
VTSGSGQRNCSSILDLAILNSYVLVLACGWKKISHRPLGKPASTESNISRLDSSGNKHCPLPLKKKKKKKNHDAVSVGLEV